MRCLSTALCYAMLFQLLLPEAGAQQPMPTRLNVLVLDGEGVSNNLRSPARQPVLRVEDENHEPVKGAAVVFILPTSGAGGDFEGSKSLIVTTDAMGMAAAHGLKTNQTPGKVVILATASYRGISSRVSITQFNTGTPEAKGSSGGHGKLIAILAVVGAAGAGGAIAGMHKGSGSSNSGGTVAPTTTSIGISSASVTVGAPRP